jgi:hypothetical protein
LQGAIIFPAEAMPMTTLGLILLVVVVLLLLGALPTWPYSRAWGYRPSGVIGFILLILLVLFVLNVV